MSLFPEENVLTKEMESWKVFADSLRAEEDKKMFLEMLDKCQKYAIAINAKGRPFPTEPLIMALLLEQHKMINWLQNKIPTETKILQVFVRDRKSFPRQLVPEAEALQNYSIYDENGNNVLCSDNKE
jgi:hypothetical protein